MRVTFLGTADGHTSDFRDHSGLLLQTSETSLLLDCGARVSSFLQQHGLSPDVPEMIWISHMHSDHIGQFGSLIQSLWLRSRRAPLHVLAPAKIIGTLREWLEKCILFPELIGFPIQWHPVKTARKTTLGSFIFTPFNTEHLSGFAKHFQKRYPGTCFDCYGTAITYRKQRLVYSSDLALPSDLQPALRQPVDHLFCELTHFPREELFGELSSAPVKNLWLTHYPDEVVGTEKKLRALALAHGFHGKVRLMKDGSSHVI